MNMSNGPSLGGSNQQSALRAIKSYEMAHGIPFDEMPTNFAYFGDEEELDLGQWSIIVSDKTMLTIAEVCRSYQESSRQALKLPPEKARGLIKPSLRTLKVTRTEGVTDRGIKEVVDACRTLAHLDLSHVPLFTDVGIREVALALGSSLRVLKINGDSQVKGEGISVLGDCCPLLKELHMSRCTGIKDWAFSRVWHGCGKLEVVDLSHCSQIADQTIREMAAGCPHLQRIDLEEVQQVSDVAVLAMSHSCHDLEALNLSRTNLLFKITDVAMLALGERCPLLQELKVANCNYISDVGLHWLAAGCLALKHLDLQGCTKIGNPGLRALSEKCHELGVLNLKGVRLVTDVGVKHLSQGCTTLTTLDLSGIYLISDGVKRDFGAEGLAALSQGCLQLRHLNLSGCFRVAKLALKAMGKGLAGLEKISLANNSSLTEAGMAELFRGCGALTHLDLTECGSCVTDKMMVDLGLHCPRLKVLVLKGSDRVGLAGMKAIGKHCKALETIDLTGCVSIDDLALLPLAEAEFQPGLKHVTLKGCVHVSDTGLSWLADSCPTITTLSLKGTGVSLRSLQAVKDVWSWSALRKTDEEFGIYPFHRLPDRRFIDHHARRYRAATKMTALVRGYLGRLRVFVLRVERRKVWVVTRIQSLFRKYLAIALLTSMKREVQHKHHIATIIQCMYRCWKARQKVARRRAEVFHALCMGAATEIQRSWRGLLGRRRAKKVQEERAALRARQKRSALDIQRVYRAFLARRVVREMRLVREKERKRRMRATLLLQRAARGHMARLRVKRILAERSRVAQLRLASAVSIQRVYRGHCGRRRVAAMRKALASRHYVVVWLQKHWRGYVARQKFESVLQQLQLDSEEKAATLIQCYWRRGLAYLLLRQLKRQQADQLALVILKTHYIQRVYRGFKARSRVRSIRAERARWKEMGAQLELACATKIQASFRRFRAQVLTRKMRHERKTRWKELVDDKTGRKFFYNKISGEVRWRTPQDVLDLMPRPWCSDCSYFEATVECATCTEFFCNQCWKRVHQGGKRASHEFRVLYDYYHKRMDYGEGEFPSRWPSDLQQDDINGYKLRVYPNREPTALLMGDWEEYRDKGDPSKPLYYNRITGQSTYSSPMGGETSAMAQQQLLLQASPAQQVQAASVQQQEQQLTDYCQQPAMWQKFYDEATRLPYYYNPVTDESTYQRPPEYQSPRVSGASQQEQQQQQQVPAAGYGTDGSASLAASSLSSLAAGGQMMMVADPQAAWAQYQDANGYAYYYNSITQEATYETPPHYITTASDGGIVAV